MRVETDRLLTPLQFATLGYLREGERSGRQIRLHLKDVGFVQSGPSFYQLMGRLQGALLVEATVNEELIRQIAVRENIYRLTDDGEEALRCTREFFLGRKAERESPIEVGTR